jgi:hypothetical protein
MSRKTIVVAVVTTFALFALVAIIAAVLLLRRPNPEPLAAQLYNVGTLQDDGTVLYSLLYYSGPTARTDLTVSGTIPESATFVEAVIAPAGATFNAAAATEASWSIPAVAAETVLGPFTYRVQFNGGDVPFSLPGRISWVGPQTGSLEAQVAEGSLQPLAETGQIRLDPEGTRNDAGELSPVPVGETGIWIYAPENAAATPVTLTFTRLPVTPETIPPGMADTWWCALVMITADTPVTFNQPILLGLPTRQVLTLGIPVQVVGRADENEPWQPLAAAEGMRMAGGGNLAPLMLTGSTPGMIAVGVSSTDRADGSTSTSGSAAGSSGFNSGFNSFGSFNSGFNGFGSGFQGNFGGFNSFGGSFQGGFGGG